MCNNEIIIRVTLTQINLVNCENAVNERNVKNVTISLSIM